MFPKSPKCKTCVECHLRSPLFNLLSEDELHKINIDRYEVEYRSGDYIFKQGSAANNILSLTQGKENYTWRELTDKI